MSDNAQQIEFWNGPAGERWAQMQAFMDRNLSYVTAALMPFAAAKQGESALDVGCGCATTSLLLADAVGEGGRVMGVDISAPMLGVARSRAADRRNVSFVEADASVHPFASEFDLVFSRFGVMFFADPVAAFANIRKGLKPGGRLAFACWRAPSENAWAAEPMAAAQGLLPPQDAPDPHAPGPFAFADANRLMGILEKAGFAQASSNKLDTVMSIGATLDDAVNTTFGIGPLSRALSGVDDETREKIRRKVKQVLAKYETPAGITPPAACWLVSARV